MCALCGVLGGNDHWTDPVKREGVYTRGSSPSDRRRERLIRIAEANTMLKLWSLSLDDWQGSTYILRTMTGASEVIDNLAALWPAAEKLARRPLDPLEPAIIARREQLND
jgi:hypothetical protein